MTIDLTNINNRILYWIDYSILGIKTKQHYYQKRKRIPNISVQEKEAVEQVFSKYGITDPNEIWGYAFAFGNSVAWF